MEAAVYKFTLFISKTVGTWFFKLVAQLIAACYFLLLPHRVWNSVDFYRALFPGKWLPYYLWCSWKQYKNFTKVFLDRFVLLDSGQIAVSSSGWNHLENAINQKEGGIILMSHIGNWEVAAHLLKKRNQNMNLLLYLGVKHKEQIEKLQKESLENDGTKVIAVDQNGSSPFLLLEALKWMNKGGLVSLTGDLVWTIDQKVVTVDFLGKKADLPETPFMLALLSRKPIFFMFALPDGKNGFKVTVSEPVYVHAANRAERKKNVVYTAQHYAERLTETIREAPFEWFHFEKFLK